MKTTSRFRPYNPDQLFLLPQDMKQWLPEEDLVYFIMDVVKQVDLRKIYRPYESERRGQPPYNPTMMVGLLLYAYAVGMPSSRKIEQATYHSIPFRVLTANQQPDHDTIADFRKRHLKTLAGLFVQVLRLCQKAGLVKFGHIALDGTKVKANASKHKAMSYGRMEKKAAELKKEVEHLLTQAEQADMKEDVLYGKGKRSGQLPKELQFRQTRLQKIQEAKLALEEEARIEAAARKAEYEAKKKAYDNKTDRRGRPPKAPSGQIDSKRQRNFTDPDSRIMPASGSKDFIQGYNCQAAVDGKTQVIVATGVTQETNDKQQIEPLIEKIEENTAGKLPKVVSADTGYFSETNCNILDDKEIKAYVATGKQKHGEIPLQLRGRIPNNATVKERMARKLRTIKGRATYSLRKQIVEPVFGQIKGARNFRQFSFRGLENCQQEWDLVCLTHNLLKLFRNGWAVNPA
ncbi:MAG: IS1182 family transposase [Proteobacteria bacterium]|jgi:transposase|nr:IS1182 family transposase [Pseudomonadota bacterium]MDX2433508.1 IS1182 family transposase [Desulfobacterales bacterium]